MGTHQEQPALPAAARPWPVLCFCTPPPATHTSSLSSRLRLHLFASRFLHVRVLSPFFQLFLSLPSLCPTLRGS